VRIVYFITHPEVVIDARVPVPRWPLSERGIERTRLMLKQPWIAQISSIYCSSEQKAIDGAIILADHLSLPINQVAELGENDRSATGFLPAQEFEAVADQFFAKPYQSVRGWETAVAAQRRIVATVDNIIAQDATTGAIAIVAHGGVGTLLLCHLAG
jgi:broad specificity phosphatase PhoE